MAYMALYRAWRPMTFEDVVEQDTVITILKNAVMNNRIAHAYLFCGTRGTGKTTMAKIFSRAINCLNPQNGSPCNQCDICKGVLNGSILDVTEIDAASNNGVDNIRDIIEETAYATSVAKYKVYIIDEVHMLSTGAFNALLKTLEEPPEGVVFILATTEPQKLPSTIISRCQRYDFKRISHQGIIERLETICQSQGTEYDKAALAFIAQKADGALRDAISMLDQTMSSSGSVTLSGARQMTGSVNKDVVENFVEYILKSDTAGVIRVIDEMFTDGRDPATFIAELMNIFRNIAIMLITRDTSGLIYEDEAGMAKLKEFTRLTTSREITMIIMELSRLENSLKWAVQRKIVFEAGMIALCDRRYSSEANELTNRISYLEDKVDELSKKILQLKVGTVSPSNMMQSDPEPTVTKEPVSAPAPSEPELNKQTQAPSPLSTSKPVPPPPPPPPPRQHLSEPTRTQGVRRTPNTTNQAADSLDWRDFLSNLSREGFASMTGIISSCSKGIIIDDNTLGVLFNSKMTKAMIEKQNHLDVLTTCATAAYGKQMNVVLLDPSDPIPTVTSKASSVPQTASVPIPTQPADANPAQIESSEKESSFDDSLDVLKQLAADGDFTISEQ
ncbi:MAG: DNA polymerase III subunit gamma/tau [Ruminococcaceae bacterium]|nr:DNA polymerase III subunit gamma/tau [Oscillospiraceae bacterium]